MAKSFVNNVYYRLVDENGFINHNACNEDLNKEIVRFIMSLGNKFKVKINDLTPQVIIQGNSSSENVPMDSMMRDLRQHEAKYFEEVIDDEVPMKEPNVPYSYSEVEIKETLTTALQDDAFFAAVKMLSAADAAHVLSLKFGSNA